MSEREALRIFIVGSRQSDVGLVPEVVVSHVVEDADGPAEGVAALLAQRKARAVAAELADPSALVLGCDSVLDLDGDTLGKPADPADAVRRWQAMRGEKGTLVTGHCLIDTRAGASAGGVASTVVRFGTPTDAEIAAYVATGEPLSVAGGFTIEGYGAPFVDGVEGDASNVIGLSLPLFRVLLGRVGVAVTDLWGPR